MNSLNTLFLPGTALRSLRLYPIYLLFQNVHLLAPVEDAPGEGGKDPSDSFIKSGFCQVHTPCPLGPDRNRFLRLVADIRTRKDDYAAQLSSLTLAAMSGSGPQAGEESERSIAKALFPQAEMPPEAKKCEDRENLWQARLVLAIGELLDQEEEEIALNMAVLEDEEKVLFKELQGEDDTEEETNPFAELTRMEGALQGISATNVKKRLKAWKTLFLAGDIDCGIFLTYGKECGDILLETYQQRTGHQAPLVASLQLPTFIGWNSSEASTAVRNFTTKNSTFLSTMEERLTELIDQTANAGQPLKLAALQLSLADACEKLLAADFPADRFGRIPLNFYLFPGLSCSTLVGKTTNASNPGKNGLLAVIG